MQKVRFNIFLEKYTDDELHQLRNNRRKDGDRRGANPGGIYLLGWKLEARYGSVQRA
jgi:hypothetical protein